MPKLIQKTEDNPLTCELVSGITAIGRGVDCELRLSTEGIKRLHAVIDYSGGSLTLTAQNEGILKINNEDVTEATLKDGDEVLIGSELFVVEASDIKSSPVAAGVSKRSSRKKRANTKPAVATKKANSNNDDEYEDDDYDDEESAFDEFGRKKIEPKLSPLQQMVIKVVCMAIMLGSFVAGAWILDQKSKRDSQQGQTTIIFEDPLEAPREKAERSKDLWRLANKTEKDGDINKAFELLTESVAELDEAERLYEVLSEKYPGVNYNHIRDKLRKVTEFGSGIRGDHFRLEMLVLREKNDAKNTPQESK